MRSSMIAKGTQKCVIKHKLAFDLYKNALFKNRTKVASQLRFGSDHHDVCTEEINKIALSNNDDKTLQDFDGITTYPYGTNAFIVCMTEMLVKRKELLIAIYY